MLGCQMNNNNPDRIRGLAFSTSKDEKETVEDEEEVI